MKRNLIQTLLLTVGILSSSVAFGQKAERLFNGNDLSNWKFVLEDPNAKAEETFFVKNDLIHITGKPLGYMYTNEVYRNCKLHVEWRWPDGIGTNSGIFLLIAAPSNPFPNGVECQLKAGSAGDLIAEGGATMAEYRETGEAVKFKVVKKNAPSSEKPQGEWNSANIFIIDGVMTIYVNGAFQNMGTNPCLEGHIGLQSEGGSIEFRNVTVTPIN